MGEPGGVSFAAYARGLQGAAETQPARTPVADANGRGDSAADLVSNEACETRRLSLQAPRDAAATEAILLAALARALATRAEDAVEIGVEHHGRTEATGEIIGWFTEWVTLRLPAECTPEHARAALAAARSTRKGAEPLANVGVLLNFLGPLEASRADGTLFSLASESTGAERAPAGHRPHTFELSAYVDGVELSVEWRYGASAHPPGEVVQLADALVTEWLQLEADHQGAPSDAAGVEPQVDAAALATVLAQVRRAAGETP